MKLTTITGAARILGLNPLTIYRYIEQGLLDVAENERHVKMVNPEQVRRVMNNKRPGRPRTKRETLN